MGPQPPSFEIEEQSITISNDDAQRLIAVLRESPEGIAASAADKIDAATELFHSTEVRLGIGEDQAVLDALAQLQATGSFHTALRRVRDAITDKIARESASR
jgi:hypothetical protein